MKARETSLESLLSALSDNLSAEEIALAGLKAEIASTIAGKRVRRGMNQKEFAEYMGVSQGLVSRWENGEANFTLQSLAEIAVKLDIKLQSPFATVRKRTYKTMGNLVVLSDWHTVSSAKPSWKSSSSDSLELEEM
jgi:transcriptional regulator with XRE-family HTH domain